MLASYEGVIAADTGHISTHEAGAIEFTGHKVMTLPHKMEKLQLMTWIATSKTFTQMPIMLIWFTQEWFIFRIRRSMVHFIASQS